MRIGQGRALGDDVAGRRLVVGRGGAGIDILAGATLEQAIVPLHLVRGEAYEFADAVKGHVAQLRQHAGLVVDVRDDGMGAFGHGVGTVAPVQQPDLPAQLVHQPADNGGADGAGAADKQCFLHSQ